MINANVSSILLHALVKTAGTEPVSARIEPRPSLAPFPRSSAVVVSATMLMVSSLPDIILVRVIGSAPSWLLIIKAGVLAVLIAASCAWRPLRDLRGYWSALLALLAFAAARPLVNFSFAPLQTVFGGSAFDARMQPEQTGKFALSLAMIVTLRVLGYTRREIFLCAGNLRARMTPVRWLGFPKPDPWPSFALQWSVYIAAALFALQFLTNTQTVAKLSPAVRLLPSILFYAALNAFNEEMSFRAPILATLEPVCGRRTALWISASFFGIAHYFGMPGGFPGILAATFMGWMLAKAMLETRGLFWAWWIHFLSDVAIFFFMAAGTL